MGGEDFDQRLMEHCLKKFKSQHKKDFSKDQKAMARLRKQCETAKRTLSTQTSAQIEVSVQSMQYLRLYCLMYMVLSTRLKVYSRELIYLFLFHAQNSKS